MASGMGDILKYGLLAGAAYLIYQQFFATPAAAPGATGGTPPPAPPAAPPYTYVPPTLAVQLANSNSSGNANLNADQWAYYWNNTLSKAAIDPTVFTSLFFPNGRPSNPSQSPTMTAAQFVAALGSKGVSGLGAVVLRPPVLVMRRRYR